MTVSARLKAALPQFRDWVTQLEDAHRFTSRPVAALAFPRLPSYYPPALLESVRFVEVPTTPFPPVLAFGLPEFRALAVTPFAGITFGQTFYVADGQVTETLCFHEIIHTIQWRILGFHDFLLTYATGILQSGYEQSPLEAVAYVAQSAFDRHLPLPGLIDKIAHHAQQVRDVLAPQWDG